MPVFFNINRYLTDKHSDIVWGYHPPTPEIPQMDTAKAIF